MTEKTAASAPHAPSSKRLEPLRQVDAGVLSIAYYEAGPADGPAVMLMHGFPYDIHSYVDVAPQLAAQGCRVIVPYLRGYGPTRFRDSATPRSGEQAAVGADMMALMDALGIKRAVFAGYDWGGRAACVGAALWPERCIGLVCVNSYLIQDIANAMAPQRPEREVRAVVPVLLPARARPRGTCRQPARDRQNIVDAMVAELAVRRCLFRADRNRPRQSRLCRCGDPQLSPPFWSGRRRSAICRNPAQAGGAAADHRANDYIGRRRRWRRAGDRWHTPARRNSPAAASIAWCRAPGTICRRKRPRRLLRR